MNRQSIAFTALMFLVANWPAMAQNSIPFDPPTAPPSVAPKKPPSQGSSPDHRSASPTSRNRNVDPSVTAAQQQSGLNQAEAGSLINGRGYDRMGELQAEPNSIWVWQADAMKNGRRVRLGIDHRGNLLEISSGLPLPCRTPGLGFGGGGLGVGTRLSEATTCSGR
jgi:hypothetical protein